MACNRGLTLLSEANAQDQDCVEGRHQGRDEVTIRYLVQELRHAGFVDDVGEIELDQPTKMMIDAARTEDAVTILNRVDPIAILILREETKLS